MDNRYIKGTLGIPINKFSKMYKYWKTSAIDQNEFFEYQENNFKKIFNSEKLPDIMVTYYEPSKNLLELMPNNSIWHYGNGNTYNKEYICNNR